MLIAREGEQPAYLYTTQVTFGQTEVKKADISCVFSRPVIAAAVCIHKHVPYMANKYASDMTARQNDRRFQRLRLPGLIAGMAANSAGISFSV